MALQVWLPLNGNLDNQGLSSVVVNNGGATVDNTGKIGKCYSFDGSSKYVSTNYDMYFDSGTKGSFSMWLYPTVNSCAIIGSQNFQIQVYIGSDNKLWFNQWNASGQDSLRGVSSVTLNLNTWTHVCFTWDGTEMSMYLDGTFNTKFTALYDTHKTGNFLNIGGNVYMSNVSGASRFFSGKINDVRIYDHCLSPKEVKEISKALVLHYKLNKPNANLISGSNVRMSENGETPAREYLAICSPQGQFDQYGLVPYTISFDIKSAVSGTFNIYGSPGTGFKYCFTAKNFNVTTEWQRFSYTFTPYVANPTGSWSSISIYGTYNTGKIPSVRRVKLELGTKETPLIDDTSYAADCSGYKNDGTPTGSVATASTDTARYNTSLHFNGTSYIYRTPLDASSEIKTISFWANWTTIPSGQSVLFVDNGTKTGFGLMSTGILLTTSAAGNSKTYPKTGLVANTWYHFVIVITGSTTRDLYINGEKQTPTSSTSNWTFSINQLQVGKRSSTSDGFVGKMVDFRMYATALSEEDIKELYETAAMTDDGGVFGCYEFQETGSLQLDNTGLFKIKEIKEHETLNDAAIYSDKLLANRLVEI